MSARFGLGGLLIAVLGCQGTVDGAPSGEPTTAAAGSSGAASAGAPGSGAAGPAFEPLGGPEPITCDPAARGLSGRRLWRLTRAQYERSVRALFGSTPQALQSFTPEPGSEQGFQNDAFALRVRVAEASQFQAAAHELATQIASGELSQIAACAAAMPAQPGCGASLVSDLGRRVFRRPLNEAERARYLELYELGSAKRDARLGLEVLLEALLQSPHFLYRSELGGPAVEGKVSLSQHELADLLSYTLTSGPPDAELSGLADAGMLSGAVEAQARRLLTSPEARPALWQFYQQLFELTSLADIPKDEAIFPEFEAARADLEASARALVEHVLFDADARVETLLTGSQAFVNQRLSPFFGVNSEQSALELSTAGPEHPGLLGHPAVMSVLAARTRTSPVNRGRFVRERLLCEHLADPPPNVDTQLPQLEPGATARQQLDAKTSGAACAGCHRLMNPVGFGFEKLDGIGRYRSEENGQPLDDSGELSGTRDIDGPFQGVAELASKLASSSQVQECLAVQGFRYVLGRPETAADACSLVEVRERFSAAGLDLKELYLAIIASEAFSSRKAD